mmetsp:Transcript_15396/g.36425  ORF Transcript_15396/g.36425 Transcript_15396/m.36425 type:complete len:465 (-) Transcript_15396:21-1415(-)
MFVANGKPPRYAPGKMAAWLSPRRAAGRALCRCDRSLALGHVREVVGHCLGGKLVAVAVAAGIRVPRFAVFHVDVAVVLLVVLLLILFERVADLVPDLADFPTDAEDLGRHRAVRAEAGLCLAAEEVGLQHLVRNDAFKAKRGVFPISVQHVHALRHHSQCGDARLERVLRLLAVRSVWLVEHALRDVGGDEEDVLEEVLVVLQVLGSGLQQRLVLQTFLGPRCVAFHSLLPHAAEDAIAHRVCHHVEAQRLLAPHLLLEAGEELPEGFPGEHRVLLVFPIAGNGPQLIPQYRNVLQHAPQNASVVVRSPVDGHDENSLRLLLIKVRLHRVGRFDHLLSLLAHAVEVEEQYLSLLGQQGGEDRLRHGRAREVAQALVRKLLNRDLLRFLVSILFPLRRDGGLVLVLHVHEEQRQLARLLRVAIEHDLVTVLRLWSHGGHQELGQLDIRCGVCGGAHLDSVERCA